MLSAMRLRHRTPNRRVTRSVRRCARQRQGAAIVRHRRSPSAARRPKLAMMGAAVAATMAATAAAVTTPASTNSLTQQGEIAFTTMLQSGDKAKAFRPTCRTSRARRSSTPP